MTRIERQWCGHGCGLKVVNDKNIFPRLWYNCLCCDTKYFAFGNATNLRKNLLEVYYDESEVSALHKEAEVPVLLVECRTETNQ